MKSYHFPIAATRGDESTSSILEKWTKFDSLPETSKNKLSSEETALTIKNIGLSFDLDSFGTSLVAITTRDYYFGELNLEDMPFVFAKEIPIDLTKAKEITNLVIQKIINDNSQEIAYQAQLEHLPISEALKVFPEIGEQMITTEKITLKNFPEPVRPSLKNWLADYTFTVGYDNKDSIKRGNYIFHGGNTQRLASVDRDRLASILKAHDEGTPITIDKIKKQIVFPASTSQNPKPQILHPQQFQNSNFQNPKPTAPAQRPIQEARIQQSQTSASLHNSVSFSSPQQLPYEKLKTQQPAKQELVSRVKFPPIQQPRTTTSVNNIVKLEPKPEKPREMPRNTVNLKDLQ